MKQTMLSKVFDILHDKYTNYFAVYYVVNVPLSRLHTILICCRHLSRDKCFWFTNCCRLAHITFIKFIFEILI